MPDPTVVLWLIAALSITTTIWSLYTLHYSKRCDITESNLIRERPLTGWWLNQMRWLVRIDTVALLILSAVQMVRNSYFLGGNEAEGWMTVVVIQNILLFAISSLPATYLFTLGWGIKAIEDERQGRLDDQARAFLNLHRDGWQHVKEHQESE